MVKIKIDGIDDLMKDLERLQHKIDDFKCPDCRKPFCLDLDADTVTCPHCGITIKINKT